MVTLYTTLSEDAVVHGVTETEVTHVITSHQLMKKMRPVLERCPAVTTVIYMEDQVRIASRDMSHSTNRFLICAMNATRHQRTKRV